MYESIICFDGGIFFGRINAAFPESKLLACPSPTETPEIVDPSKEAELRQYQHAVAQLESIISDEKLKPEHVFAGMRGIAKNYEGMFALGIGSIKDLRSYIIKAIEYYNKIIEVCSSDKDPNSIDAAERLLRVQNLKRNFELNQANSK